MKTPQTSRRRFLKTGAAAVAAPTILPSGLLGQNAPSKRVTVGCVGIGGRGRGLLGGFLGHKETHVLAVCDVQDVHYGRNEGRGGKPLGREAAKQEVEAHYTRQKDTSYKGCEAYKDYRELCARDDIDAVVVATPDHWHALCTVEALNSGKDVYCEKPVTHYFAEGQKVVEAVKKNDSIFQVGSQQRSTGNFHQAVELVQNGVLGKIHEVKVGLPKGHAQAQGDTAVMEPPAGLDYDFWCGPMKVLPYMRARHHWNWRWTRTYGGGQLMDWIGHHNDICHWGLGMDKSGPVRVESVGWTWPETEVYDTPVLYEFRAKYANGVKTSVGAVNPMGTKWIGENGWIYVNRGKLEASNPEWLMKGFEAGDKTAYKSTNHTDNFIQGVKSRKPCICPAETGHRSITPGHLAYVSDVLGRAVKWNPEKEEVIGDEEAQKLLMALPYREGYDLG